MPSSTLPAAAPGLPAAIPTRRAALTALAGVGAALSLPKAVRAMPAPNSNVAELTRAYDAAMVRTRRAIAQINAAEARRGWVSPPEPLFVREDDPLLFCFSGTRYDTTTGRQWFGNPERIDLLRSWDTATLTGGRWAKVLTRRAEVLDAYDRWEADRKRADEMSGVTAATLEYRAAYDEQEMPALQRIVALRSTDPAALRLKLRVYVEQASALDWRADLDDRIAHDAADGVWDDALAGSILRDVLTAHPRENVA